MNTGQALEFLNGRELLPADVLISVFPGGGYQILAVDLEGTEVCDWLTPKGIMCVLLKYRVTDVGPYPKSGPYPESPMALEDAQRAMGLVRFHAAEWHIDPHKIGVLDPEHAWKHLAREPGDPAFAQEERCSGTHREVSGCTPMMNERGKSDRPIVPGKSLNKAGQLAAEEMEGRGLTKGNPQQQNASRTLSRNDAPSAPERIRQAASKDKEMRFTALLHHVHAPEALRAAYLCLKREASPGVDGETWRHYGENLETNLQDLSHRLKSAAYRAKPVRRVYIPKTDGRLRPLGVTALEDKIVQRATVEVMNAIYEADFLGFSYGFRPGRSQHNSLDALYTGLLTKHVNWVLDLDIRGFFDAILHEWLVKFIEHRIADRRVVRLIQKWLNAGVLEDGKRTRMEEGTPRGGSASPLLANIYLDYVFDLWGQAEEPSSARTNAALDQRSGNQRHNCRSARGCNRRVWESLHRGLAEQCDT